MNAELISEAVAKGVDLLQRGVTDFSNWSRSMVYCFGEPIRPQLDCLWLNSHDEWQRRQTAEPVLLSNNQSESPSEQKSPHPPSEVESSSLAAVRKSEAGDALAAPGQPEPSLPDEQLAPTAKVNYLLRHWRGELPLPVSYWVNGILGFLLVGILSGVVSAFDASGGLKAAVAGAILLYVLSFIVSIWQIVGTWRSASNHTARGGNGAWAVLAKVVLVLGMVNLVRLTASASIPQLVEYSNILAGDTKIPPHEVRVLPGGNEVEFSGGIRAGSAKDLEHILNAVPQVKVLHVNSMGGRIREAERMAELVRKLGLTTYTSEQCLSAATLVFIAGKERVVSTRAKIGFHRGWFPGMTERQRRASNEALRKTMLLAGVSDGFITHVLATPHESMWYPTIQEMKRANVVTSESFGERFVVSGAILRSSNPGDIDKAWGAMPGLRAIKEIEPDTYWTMVNEVSAAIQSGKTVMEIHKIVRPTSEHLVMKYLPLASDEALLATRDGWVELLERLKDRDSEACVAMFAPKSVLADFNYASRISSEWENTNYLAVLDKVLRSAAEGGRQELNAVEAEQDLKGIRSKLHGYFGRDVALLTKQVEWMKHSHRVCEMLLALYRETQNIPQPRQGNLLRYMLSGVTLPSSSAESADNKNADPTGTWTWGTPGQDGGPEQQITLKLNLEREKVTGTLSVPGKNGESVEVAISDGKLQDQELSFAVTLESQGNMFTAVFSGNVSGGSIDGKVSAERNGQVLYREWAAKRVAPDEEPSAQPGGSARNRGVAIVGNERYSVGKQKPWSNAEMQAWSKRMESERRAQHDATKRAEQDAWRYYRERLDEERANRALD